MGTSGMYKFGLVLMLTSAAIACSSTPDTTELSAPTTPAAATPGAIAVGEVDINGTTIEYATLVPDNFQPGDTAPLLLAFPPGGQRIDLAESTLASLYAPEALRLGWVVVSPAAPNGELYFQGSEALVPGFLDWVETWVAPEGGAPHVAGISNGGISSFRYATQNPDRVLSVTTLPGFPRSDADREALESLTDIPVRLYVGQDDDGWVEPALEAADTINGFGGDATATVFPGEGHIMASTADGTVVFAQLEAARP